MRSGLVVATTALALTVSSVALAEDGCSADDWFCEEVPADEGESTSEPAPASSDEPDEPASSKPPPPPKLELPETKDGKGPPVVVYYPYDSSEKESAKIVVDRPENEPKPPKKRVRRRHGLKVQAETALLGHRHDKASNAGMAGIGVAYRFRPIGSFALDTGIDFFGGHDFQGFRRRERALTLTGVVFFNPKSKVQIYGLAGFGFAAAKVDVRDRQTGDISREDYRYFGMHTGLGLEFLVGRRVSLNADVVGFLRGRIDDRATHQPEFVNASTGQATNTSGGGLVRGGLTIYF